MIFNIMVVAMAVLQLGCSPSYEATNVCPTTSISDEGLERSSCRSEGTVSIAVYADKNSQSPYSTIFDQRELLTAEAPDLALLLAFDGFQRKSAQLIFAGSRLTNVPYADSVSSKDVDPEVEGYKDWKIGYETIQYSAQGGRAGFSIDCATAVHIKSSFVAISECYPMEHSERFLRTLDKVIF